MIPVAPSLNPLSGKPFTVVLEKQPLLKNQSLLKKIPHQPHQAQHGSRFAVSASLRLTSELRTCGLLRALAAEEARSLLVLLTFVSESGDCRAYLTQLCEALQLSPGGVKKRMGRLQELHWQGEPLVHRTQSPSGLVTYTLNPRLRQIAYALPPGRDAAVWNDDAAQPPALPSNREAVLELSRTTYGRQRAEVERGVEEQLGHGAGPNTASTAAASQAASKPRLSNTAQHPELSESQSELQRALEHAGVSREQAQRLLARYASGRIRRQLAWLPYRNARNPGAFLVSAIENDYHQPLALRPPQLMESGHEPSRDSAHE